ncbi:MAG: ROK family protein [Cyclobacteriaceae bacterium]|nr:ROK family protein [Cyclobacteriaceae bacterium]MCH8516326.1 ROK family protein [Cyclobacteriaceae bacterium]
MSISFFKELDSDQLSGVAYKNTNIKKKLVSHFANIGNATISELCKTFNLSAPKVSSLVQELIEENVVIDHGKVESTGGRKPNLYGIMPESGFFVGIDVRYDHVNLGITDFTKNLVYTQERISYNLENNRHSLDLLCKIIHEFIEDSPYSKSRVISIGINLSGRIKYATGYSYSFFNFDEEPLSKRIENKVGVKVFLENDSNAMAYGEYHSGIVKDEKDVLFINLDHGIGLGIITNGKVYYGKSGYSGEFGHIPLFQNDIICQCGKKGCLETEASGWALLKKVKEKLSKGESSILSANNQDINQITLSKIIEAALNDDVFAIELIGELGEKLGKGIAALINIFNPELVILGGSLARSGDYLKIPLLSAVNKYSLSLMNNDTKILLSSLENKAGIIGAGLIARNRALTFI